MKRAKDIPYWATMNLGRRQRILRPVARFLVKRQLRLQVEGLERIPECGGAIIAQTHASKLDGIVTGSVVQRTMRAMSSEVSLRKPLRRRFMTFLGSFPVDNSGCGGSDAGMEIAQRVLNDAGDLLLMFPEGDFTTSGDVGRLRTGTARLAMDTGCPIVPATWHRDRTLDASVLIFGKPIQIERSSTVETVTAELHRRLSDLVVRAQAAVQPTVSRHACDSRILIISSDVGGGHNALAEAICEEFAIRHPGVSTQIEDGVEIVSPWLRKRWRETYARSVAEGTYSDRHAAFSGPKALAALRGAERLLMSRRLKGFISDKQPDIVVSTFPYFSEPLGALRRRGRISSPVFVTLIDAGPHPLWFARGVDGHMALNPNDEDRVRRADPLRGHQYLNLHTVRPVVTPRLWDDISPRAVRERFGLPADAFVALLSGGSMGLLVDSNLVRRVLAAAPDVHFAILTGSNPQLTEAVAAFEEPRAIPVAYTDQMPALLRSVDVLVANSAGMTVLEAFAVHTPVVLFNVVPGHGVDGATALEADDFAAWARSERELALALHDVQVGDPRVTDRVRRANRSYDAPYISDRILEVAGDVSSSVVTRPMRRLNA